MDDGKRRIGPTLMFDPNREKDILACIDKLNGTRELAHLISHLLRLAFESPEVFGTGKEVLSLIDKMEKCGVSPTRYSYFNQLNKEVEAMKKKIDSIYEMSYKTYMLAQMGKHLGLEQKSENNLRASFILERQASEMCDILGVTNINHVFASNKLDDVKSKSGEVLEYIIDSYDGILSEIKDALNVNLDVNANIGYSPSISEISNKSSVVNETSLDENNTQDEDESTIDLVERPNKYESESVVRAVSDEDMNLFDMLTGNGEGNDF